MNKEAMEIRHKHWKNMIDQCNSRPQGQTVAQWVEEHGISLKTYYRWRGLLRREGYDQLKEAKLPSTNQDAGVSFTELTIPQSSHVKIEDQVSFHTDAIIQTSQCTIAVSNSTSEQLLKEILEVTRYVG